MKKGTRILLLALLLGMVPGIAQAATTADGIKTFMAKGQYVQLDIRIAVNGIDASINLFIERDSIGRILALRWQEPGSQAIDGIIIMEKLSDVAYPIPGYSIRSVTNDAAGNLIVSISLNSEDDLDDFEWLGYLLESIE